MNKFKKDDIIKADKSGAIARILELEKESYQYKIQYIDQFQGQIGLYDMDAIERYWSIHKSAPIVHLSCTCGAHKTWGKNCPKSFHSQDYCKIITGRD